MTDYINGYIILLKSIRVSPSNPPPQATYLVACQPYARRVPRIWAAVVVAGASMVQ
jgi:hypothetical protein